MTDETTHHLFQNWKTCSCASCKEARLTLGEKRERLGPLLDRSPLPNPPALLWHFSSVRNYLRKPPATLKPHAASPWQPPAVWFTARSDYEPLLLGRDGKPLWKVAIPFAKDLLNLYQFGERVEPEAFFGIVLSALLSGSDPAAWYCSLSPVPPERFADVVAIEWR